VRPQPDLPLTAKALDLGRTHPLDLNVLKTRLEAVKAGKLSPKEVNYRRVCFLLTTLPYLDIHSMFLIPFNHALLLGVIPKFVDHIFTRCTILWRCTHRWGGEGRGGGLG
jgi:hypothetical protein